VQWRGIVPGQMGWVSLLLLKLVSFQLRTKYGINMHMIQVLEKHVQSISSALMILKSIIHCDRDEHHVWGAFEIDTAWD
jgi:hypothetical protein